MLFLTQLQFFFHGPDLFWFYGFKILIVGLFLAYTFKGHAGELKGPLDWKAIGIGLAVLAIWITLTGLGPADSKASFNPAVFGSSWQRFPALLLRILGMSLVVPLVEETFWRSFWMRYWTKRDFLSIPAGASNHLAFWLTALAFAFMHSKAEWFAAFLAAIGYGAYLVKTRNMAGTILAHAVTNLGLACYILVTGRWYLWG